MAHLFKISWKNGNVFPAFFELYTGQGFEAIDTLVKGMEDNRDDLVVILAGYSVEMEQFLSANSGLKSRFPNVIQFHLETSLAIVVLPVPGFPVKIMCIETSAVFRPASLRRACTAKFFSRLSTYCLISARPTTPLAGRYVMQNGRLIDAGGALVTDAVGALTPRGKYLVLLDEAPVAAVRLRRLPVSAGPVT